MATNPAAAATPGPRRRFSLLTRQDRLVLALAVGIPAVIHIGLVWIPTLASVALSFTSWNGIGGLDNIEWVGIQNYQNLPAYPPFIPVLTHNLIWLAVFLFIATPIGIFLDGMRRQLQPYEVLVEFEGSQPPYTVHLNGYFLSFSARDPNLPPERVFVSGKLEASIDR